MKQVIAVVGPTASGKTDLAIELAESIGTEIVSADSMQFYRGMAIGTGQPTAEQLARVPHHFIAHLDPSGRMSAGEFHVAARAVIARLNAQGKPAVVVGGSGLYVQALLEGLFEGPGRDEALRDRLETEAAEHGSQALYRRLESVDPSYAAKIESADLRRIVRALEVYELSGSTLSTLHAEHQEAVGGLDALVVALDWPREALYARIDRRVEAMMKAGFLDEVRALEAAGHAGELLRLKAIGYRELLSHLRGETTLDEAVSQTQMFSRRYAKRQLTWYRADPKIQWLPASEERAPTFHAKHILDNLNQGQRSR